MALLDQTCLAEHPEDADDIQNVKTISLKEMANQFGKDAWWEDLADEDSDLVKFVKENMCENEHHPEVLSVSKLRDLGILWCHGNNQSRVKFLFETLQHKSDT